MEKWVKQVALNTFRVIKRMDTEWPVRVICCKGERSIQNCNNLNEKNNLDTFVCFVLLLLFCLY
jgi:hypothetical protein